ncbi:serine/threonine-protein kinase [Cryptosporangium aurantiacum]|uniref:non-specific serine/threonine protein kinase n=1 Tax=Cryptosporangium aurantiacum TaxID=134849 RepID=A0A1M7RNZ8_9ACTN|nr:serine/threonine-protein kinase [Cryptosporangium aurantiacum]SHN47984.1 Serine/threonine protein kinase [Cryptosporangium aurantiacum]
MAEQRTVHDRYRLDEVVGSGGMGVVWRAFDLRLGRTVAVKEVRFPSTMTAEERTSLTKRALLEARSAGRLDHPNIVPVHDVIINDEQPFIIMRFVEGRSLDQTVAADGPLTDQVVALIGMQLLDALGAAHAADVIHRDVKPHNVLIQKDGVAQLTDFSIASVFGTETLTKTGALLGSPGYIAPERLMTGETTPAGDLFALGATLFFAAEGIGPFTAKETIVGLFASATQPHPRPKLAGSRLTAVIDGLLEKDPGDRFDRDKARALLKAIADNEDDEDAATRAGEFVPPPPGRVDTDDKAGPTQVRRGSAPVPGLPQGDPPSENSTAVFAGQAPTQLRPLAWQSGERNRRDSGEIPRPVSGSAPISGGTVYGRPVSGAPVSGAPISGGGLASGPPVSGAGVYGGPVSGGGVHGGPVSGAGVSGGPVSGAGVSGGPVSGGPVSGGSVYGTPVSGGAGGGARELAWAPGAVSGGASGGQPPTFRPPSPSSSPPAGQRWRRALGVLTIIVLALGAGVIANLVVTQERTERANRAGSTVDGVSLDDEPSTQPTPGPATATSNGAKPVPSDDAPRPTPTTSGPTTSSAPPPEGKVTDASVAAPAELKPKDCTAPLEVSVTVTIAVSNPARVAWTVGQVGGDSLTGAGATKASPDTITKTYPFVQAKPATGTLTFTLSVTTPNGVKAAPAEVQVTCPPVETSVPPDPTNP